MELQVGVKILLQNREGKYLLLQRNLEKYPEISIERSLDIPGGRIQIGVPLMENLKREVREEIGLELINEPKLVAAQDILKTDKHVARLTYIGQIEGEPKLSEEHSSYMWYTLDELKKLEGLDSYTKEIVEKFL